MKRLTFEGNFCDIAMCGEVRGGPFCEDGDCSQRKIWERLKAIEDILCDDYDLDRLRELVEADRDGRCVVLPCKVGEKIFRLGASICMWRETDHCDEYCNGYEYRDCWEGCRAVLEDKFSLGDLPLFGKNVFITREAAETALKAREQDG